MKPQGLLFALLAALLLGWNCSDRTGIVGNGSDVGTAKVRGRILNPDGSPSAGAKVSYVHADQDPMLILHLDTTRTDASGEYRYDTLTPGLYNAFAEGGDGKLAYTDSIVVDSTTPTILEPDTLRWPGALRGVVQLLPGDDSRTVLVMVLGTTKWVSPTDSVGNFTLGNLAAGQYTLRFMSTLDSYRVLDTLISVFPDSVLNLADTVRMPTSLNSLQPPAKLQGQMLSDTSVSLRWPRVLYAAVYFVCRDTSGFGTYDTVAVTSDTSFIDSAPGLGDTSYYRISARNYALVSPLSGPCIVLMLPQTPRMMGAWAISLESVRIRFYKARLAGSYVVYRSASSSTYDSIALTTDTVFIDAEVDTGFSYSYRIKALNATGESQHSESVTVEMSAFSVFRTRSFFVAADATTPLSNLFGESGGSLLIQTGDTIKIEANGSQMSLRVATIVSNPLSEAVNLDQLIILITTFLAATSAGSSASLSPSGAVLVHAGAISISDFRLTSSRPQSSAILQSLFHLGDTIQAGSSYATGSMRRACQKADLVSSAYDSAGYPVAGSTGLEDGATINVHATVSGRIVQSEFALSIATTSFQNILDAVNSTFLPYAEPVVGIDESGSNNGIPDGAVTVFGQNITSISITAADPSSGNTNTAIPDRFNANIVFVSE